MEPGSTVSAGERRCHISIAFLGDAVTGRLGFPPWLCPSSVREGGEGQRGPGGSRSVSPGCIAGTP